MVYCRSFRRVAMAGSDIQSTCIDHLRLPNQYPMLYCAQTEKVGQYLVVKVQYKI